jgi:hypothetical protein
MSTETQTLENLMAEFGLTARVQRSNGLQTDSEGWEHYAYQFELTLRGEPLVSRGSYRAGSAHKYPPSAVQLVSAVLSDIGTVRDFDHWAEWAQEFGMLAEGDIWAGKRGPVHDAAYFRKLETDFREIKARESLLAERLEASQLEALIEAAQQL